MKRILFAIIGIIGLTLPTLADEVSFVISAPEAVEVGVPFNVGYTINRGNVKEPRVSFKDFEVLSGPNRSTAHSGRTYNGVTTTTHTVTFYYTLLAEKDGNYTLPAATIEVDGKKYTSNTATIKALPVLYKFEISAPETVEVGTPFKVSYTINKCNVKEPLVSFKNFELVSSPVHSISTKKYSDNGVVKRYKTFSYTLKATREGNFTLPAATIEIDGTEYTSDSIKIEVKPMPSHNIFTISAPKSVEVGETFNVNYTINRVNVTKMSISSDDFEIISAPNHHSTSSSHNGIRKTFTCSLMAPKEGYFTLPVATINIDGTKYTSDTSKIIVQPKHCRFKVLTPDTVKVNEPFVVVYNINSVCAKEPDVSFKDFKLLGAPIRTTSIKYKRLYEIERSNSFTYALIASKKGNYTLPSATIEVDGVKHTSDSTKLVVLPSDKSEQSDNNSPSQRQSSRNSSTTKIPDEDIYIYATLDKTTVYEQDTAILTFKLYSATNINSSISFGAMDIKDCILKEVEQPQNKQGNIEHHNGRMYRVFTLQQFKISPQKEGEIEIPSLPFYAYVTIEKEEKENKKDPFSFFFNIESGISKTIHSPKLKLNIRKRP